MNIADELNGISANLVNAHLIIEELIRKSKPKERLNKLSDPEICIRMDIARDYVTQLLKRLEEIEESIKYSDLKA